MLTHGNKEEIHGINETKFQEILSLKVSDKAGTSQGMKKQDICHCQRGS